MDEELVKLEDTTGEIVIDLEESVGWVVGDNTRHDSLVGRNDDSQHEIKAIEGLSEELESLKSLTKSVYSNKIGIANYYKCIDGPYNGYGYFVAMNGADTVKKCNSNNNDNIFGVTVSDAAFVGGQFDTVVDNADGSYTHTLVQNNDAVLVATTGLVSVRCVNDVVAGDFVISNVDGWACKTKTMSGYKVIAVHVDNNSIRYASIMLDVQADVTDKISASVMDLDNRLQATETNVLSAINLANQAMNELEKIDTSKLVTSDKIDAIEGAANDAVAKAEGALSDAINASLLASQAKEIANSAATSAESIKNEAIEKANEVLVETSELRKELADKIIQIDTELDGTILELEATKESIEATRIGLQTNIDGMFSKLNTTQADLYATRNELSSEIDDITSALGNTDKTVASITKRVDTNATSIDNLTVWKNETNVAITDIEQQTDENSSDISILTAWKTGVEEDIESIASIKTQSDSNKSSIEGLTSWKDATSQSLSSIKQQSDSNKANIDSIASWQEETNKSITQVQQQASDNESSISNLTAWQEETNTAISNIEQKTNSNESSIESLTSWQGGINNSIANVEQKASNNETKINSLTSWQDDASKSIANVEQKATNNESAISSLTTWKDEAAESLATVKQTADKNSSDILLITTWKSSTEDDISSITSIKTTADENKAAISELAKKDTELSTTIAGVKTIADSNQSSIEDITSWKDNVNPTINSVANIKQTADGNAAKIEEFTSWQGTTNTAMARIEQKADANGAYIQSTVSNMDKYSVGPHSQAYGFTLEQASEVLEEGMIYVPTNIVTETYNYIDGDEKKTYTQEFHKTYLYRWSKINDQYKWIAVDKNYVETDINTSGPSVYFTKSAPSTVDTTHGYWYKIGEAQDANGSVVEEEYEPYTLFKWIEYVTQNQEEQYQWIPVATLAGNSKSRAVSQIRQDTDKISANITNIEGSVAGIQANLSDTNSIVQTVANWQGTTGETLSTFMNEADDKYASATQVAKIVDKDGNIKEASIVAVVNNNASSINLSADYVTVEGFTTFKGEVENDINNTVAGSRIEYARSSSATTFTPTTQWNIVAPDWTIDEYMWQRIVAVKQDGSETPSNPVCIQGAKGQDGTGVTIKGVAYVKDVVVNDDIINTEHIIYQDANCTIQITNPADGDSYLIDGYLFVYSGSDNKFTCVGKIQGTQGVGVSNVVNYYMASSRGTGVTAGANGETADEQWTQAVQSTSESKPYLWNYEDTVYTNGKSESTVPTIIGNYSTDGRGISKIEEFYLISNSKTCSKPDDTTLNSATNYSSSATANTWYKTSPPTDLTNKYLWNCERITYTLGESISEIFEPALIGTHGETGNGIKSTTVTYGQSTSEETMPTDWYPEIPSVPEGSYLWTRTVIDYTDTSKQDTVNYTYAKQGKTPVKGVDYNDGKSVTVESIQYQAGTSATDAPTGDWSDDVVDVEEGQYLWTKTTFSDENVAYGVSKQGSSAIAPVLLKEWKEFAVSDSDTIAPTTGWEPTVTGYDKSENKIYIWTRTAQSWDTNGDNQQDGNPFYSEASLDTSATSISAWCKENNTTFIDGASIYTHSITSSQLATNSIHSENYEHKDVGGNIVAPSASPVPYSSNGTFLNLSDGALYSKNFVIDGGGNAHFKGEVHADGGEIAKWAITEDGFTKEFQSGSDKYTVGLYAALYSNSLQDSTTLYVGKNGNPQFYVRPTGYMCAKYGNIAGWDITEDSLTKGEIKLTTGDSIKRTSLFDNSIVSARFCVNPITSETVITREVNLVEGLPDAPIHISDDPDFINNIQLISFDSIYDENMEPVVPTDTPYFTLNDNKEIVVVNGSDPFYFVEYMYGRYYLSFKIKYTSSPFSVLSDGSLYADAISSGGGKFSVDPNGNIKITGNGSIAGWSFNNSSIYTEKQCGTRTYRAVISSSMYTGSNSNPHDPVFGIVDRTDGGWSKWLFYVRSNGDLSAGNISASYIHSSMELASDLDIRGPNITTARYGSETEYMYMQGSTLTLYGKQGDKQITSWFKPGEFAFSNQCKMQWGIDSQGNEYVARTGTWTYNSGSQVDASDANLKNSIENMDDRYDVLFDNLSSKRFKYNNGQSGRYHTGFITQDVMSALKTADIDEKEFAALCTFKRGTNEEWSGLRYSEFVSLNTWQIQKLKPRVTTLEEKVQALETENEQLKEQINLLLNK